MMNEIADPADVLIFTRGYYNEGYDIWTHPLNRGRFVEALLLYERVHVVTDGFTEIIALVEELGCEGLLRLIESHRLQFVLFPYFFAEISGPDVDWDVGSCVLRHFGDVIDGNASLRDAIQQSLERTPYDIPDIGPELLSAVEDSTLIASPDIPAAAKRELAVDFAHKDKAAHLMKLLEHHMGKACPIGDVFEVEDDANPATVQVRRKGRGRFDDAQAKHAMEGLLLVLEAEQQLALSASTGALFLSTNPLFEQVLTVKSGEPKLSLTSSADSVAGLTAAARILQLPDLCYLVNSDLIPFGRAVEFASSRHGRRLREFFADITKSQSDPDVEKAFLEVFAKSLLPQGKLEELAANAGIGNVLFVLGTGVAFASPIAGIAFSLLEKGARIAASRRWQPLLVLKRHLLGTALTRDMDRERDRSIHFPSLKKLASQGYEVVIVREFPDWEDALGEVILAAQKGKMHWHVVLPRHGDEGAEYLAAAANRLPAEETLEGILLRKLAVGRLVRVDLSFLERGKQMIHFAIERADGIEVVEGPYAEFGHLLSSVPYILRPDKANTELHTRVL